MKQTRLLIAIAAPVIAVAAIAGVAVALPAAAASTTRPLSVSASAVTVPGAVTVSGSGCTASGGDVEVTVYFPDEADSPFIDDIVSPAADGSWSDTTSTIDADEVGTATVAAECDDDSGSAVVRYTPVPLAVSVPTVTLSAGKLAIGSALTVSGSGCATTSDLGAGSVDLAFSYGATASPFDELQIAPKAAGTWSAAIDTRTWPKAGSVTVAAECDYYYDDFDYAAASLTVKAPTTFVYHPAPTLSGVAVVGKRLVVKPQAWNPKAVSWSFQWYADHSKIDGATHRSFVPTAAQAGKRIRVAVTGKAKGLPPETVRSAFTAKVARIFVTTARPKISGKAAVGKKLTVATGTWKPTPKLSYQWSASGVALKHATKPTFTPPKALAHDRIKVTVTARRRGYAVVVLSSAATAKVAAH